MFEKYRGGEFAKEGTYLNLREGEFTSIASEGDYLPGTFDQTFIRVPLALVLILGPFLGLLFVVFLPMAVPLVVAMLLVQRLKQKAPQLRDSAIQVTTYSQQPGMAYLHMEGANKEARIDSPPDVAEEIQDGGIEDIIAKLEEDIQKRREAGQK
ncbi:MAG: hypothetical protein M0T85_15180 [Dehalococcoidales bacterium]|nr:hypothetical protein [Dehalococcoidales bacterium]